MSNQSLHHGYVALIPRSSFYFIYDVTSGLHHFFFLLQPLAQSLGDLEMVSQQVSASVSEVTLARDEKAEVLFNIWAFDFCTLCYVQSWVQNTSRLSLSSLKVASYIYECSADVETAFTQRAAGKAGVLRFLLPPKTTGGSSGRAAFPL